MVILGIILRELLSNATLGHYPPRGGEANRSKEEGGGEEVWEKSLEMRHFQVWSYLEEAELAAFLGLPEWVGMKK